MKWINLEEKIPSENFSCYIVSDGAFVSVAYWDVTEFVEFEKPLLNNVTYYMPLPDAPNLEI